MPQQTEHRSLILGSEMISYTLERKKVKNINMRVHSASGCWRIFVSDRQRKAAQSAGGTRPAAGGNIVF